MVHEPRSEIETLEGFYVRIRGGNDNLFLQGSYLQYRTPRR